MAVEFDSSQTTGYVKIYHKHSYGQSQPLTLMFESTKRWEGLQVTWQIQMRDIRFL